MTLRLSASIMIATLQIGSVALVAVSPAEAQTYRTYSSDAYTITERGPSASKGGHVRETWWVREDAKPGGATLSVRLCWTNAIYSNVASNPAIERWITNCTLWSPASEYGFDGVSQISISKGAYRGSQLPWITIEDKLSPPSMTACTWPRGRRHETGRPDCKRHTFNPVPAP